MKKASEQVVELFRAPARFSPSALDVIASTAWSQPPIQSFRFPTEFLPPTGGRNWGPDGVIDPLTCIFHTFRFGAPIFNRLSASSRPQSRLQVGARVPGMGMNYQDERNLTEPMAVTVAERQGRPREGVAERSREQRCKRRNTNGQRGRVRATSWRATAKSQGHQDAPGRVRRHAPKVHDLTRGDLRRESAGEVSKDRSSVEVVRKHRGAKGLRTERLEEESGERTERNEDGVGRGNYGHYPTEGSDREAVQPQRLLRVHSEAILLCELPERKTGGSTAVCGKPHVRWCGRGDGRNPVTSTRSPKNTKFPAHSRIRFECNSPGGKITA